MNYKIGLWTKSYYDEDMNSTEHPLVILTLAQDGAWIPHSELEKYERIPKGGDNRLIAEFYRFNTPELIEMIHYEL